MTRYLLDVSALIALGVDTHFFHLRASEWALAQTDAVFLTCATTELGFVRIVGHVDEYDLDVKEALVVLTNLKNGTSPRLEFLADDHDITKLPSWVMTPKQTTDGHLLELAKAHDAVLATFDEKIPGAFLIP